MVPNIKLGLTSAISAAVVPAVEVAKHLNIQDSTISNGKQIPSVKEPSDNAKDVQIGKENEIASAIRKISSQKQPGIKLATALAVDPFVDDGEDAEDDKEEYIPYFQRVSVSGDDNTGVSNRFVLSFCEKN
jgi:hypothetical protein